MAATQNSGAGVSNWTDPSVALAFNESTLPVSGAEGTIKKPFSRPVVSAKAESRPSLTAEQQEKYQKVLETVRAWRDIPVSSAKHAAAEPLTEGERMFLTRDCLLRYLRATKWVVPDAITRIRATLVWRREYGVEKLTPDYISVENETGKQLILGYDINGRPCLILNPSLQNTERSHRQMEHLVFMIERMIDIMPPYEESLTIMVNFKNTKASQNASIKQGKETISIVQNHYPERLGRALVINLPLVITGFFKVVTPFIDPVTRPKLKFNEDLRTLVPPEQLLKAMGGDVDFEYDHATYWPALNGLAAKRRTEYYERWVKSGKLIGENENYLRGGTEKSVSETQNVEDSVAAN